MPTLRHLETLIDYDIPELFVAQDQVGTRYICSLIEFGDAFDTYLCLPASTGRIDNLRSGELDVRSAITSSETGQYFKAEIAESAYDNFHPFPLDIIELPEKWLPDPNIYLQFEVKIDSEVIKESREKQRGIIHLDLNPPEAIIEPKISTDHLGQAIQLFQRVLKYTYNTSLQIFSMDKKSASRENVYSPDNYQTEVFAFSPGSFKIHLQTKLPADLVGYSYISRALDILDSVNSQIDNPEKAFDTLARYAGHFVTSYKDLLKFIVDNNIPFSYEWSMPSKSTAAKYCIVPRQAKPLYSMLTQRVEISKVVKTLQGRFTKVDKNTSRWRLHSSIENKNYQGSSSVSLDGLVIGLKEYEILCEERLEFDRSNGKEIATLYLQSIKAI